MLRPPLALIREKFAFLTDRRRIGMWGESGGDMRGLSYLFPSVLFSFWTTVGYGGLATHVDSDKIRATANTRYYWSDGKTAVEARCIAGKPVNFKNCSDKVSKRRILWLKDVLAGVEKLLPMRLKYDHQIKTFDELIDHLKVQIALREAQGIAEGTQALRDKLTVAEEARSQLVSPQDVLKEFEKVLTTHPDLVIPVGEKQFPSAEANADLLAIVFRLVAPEDVKASWCQKTSQFNRKLWFVVSTELDRYDAESECTKLGGRLPTPEDMKGPNDASLYEIDKHHAWHAKGCPALAKSSVGKALPVFSANGEVVRMMWLTDNTGQFGATTRASMIGEGGFPCKYNSASKVSTRTKMGGVCVVDGPYSSEFMSWTLSEMPCS